MNIIDGSARLAEIKPLIIEYTDSLHMDLGFQHLSDELDHLELKYVMPYGRIFAAVTDDDKVVGCIAYHRHSDTRCEMKRLYVQKEYRKEHVGEKLIDTILESAREDGYKEMVLDTFADMMKSAVKLYMAKGFVETEPYYNNPEPGVVYLKKIL